jgi:hypothetical protein
MRKCSIQDCPNEHKGHGWCEKHLIRFRATGSPLVTKIREPGQGTIDKKGYRVVFKDGKTIAEHRWIMEQHLKRKLDWPNEIVHHINGNKLDNRFENLKLMTKAEHDAHHVFQHTRSIRKDGLKLCLRCEQFLPIESFPTFHRKGKDRVYTMSNCRSCFNKHHNLSFPYSYYKNRRKVVTTSDTVVGRNYLPTDPIPRSY